MMLKSRRSRASRAGNSNVAQNCAAEVQSLEPRSLPTGTVTASLSADGHLSLTGDKLGNSIVLEARDEGFFLTGLDNTSIKFAGATTTPDAMTGETAEVELTQALSLSKLTIQMGGGDDIVRIQVGEDSLIPPLEDLPVAITGRLRINLGNGDDHAALLLSNATLDIGGNLEGDLGNGDDCLVIGTEGLLTGQDATPETLPISVGGQAILLGRLGEDTIALAGADVQKKVIIDGDDHNDALAIKSSTLHGNVTLKGNRGDDDLVLDEVTVLGTLNIQGNKGADRLLLNEVSAAKNVSVNMGTGNDQFELTGGFTLADNVSVTLDGSDGTDELISEPELTDPPVKQLRIENTGEGTSILPGDILATIDALIDECLLVTEPTPEP